MKTQTTVSIETAVLETAHQLAKAAGMTTADWLEQLVREKTTGEAPDHLTENADGTLTAHGDFAERIESAAAAKGMTPSEFTHLALVGLATKETEMPAFIDAIYEDMLPVYLDSKTVSFLREVCEAGGITPDDFAGAIIGDIVRDFLDGRESAESFIVDGWEIEDKEAAGTAIQAVVDCWKAKEAAVA